MEGYGLSTTQLIGTLQAENLNLPAGEIEQGTARLQLRSTGEFSSLDDIRNLPITTPTGALIHLRDVADVQDLDLKLTVNGEVRQQGNTRNMIFGVPFLISYVSRYMTMEPGDILITGTPEGVSEIRPGDVVRAEIEGVGSVTNRVV